MDIGGYQLVSGCPDVGDMLVLFLAGFVVEDLVVNDVTASLEADHDASVGRYAVATSPPGRASPIPLTPASEIGCRC